MEKYTKNEGVLRGNYCETCCNIPRKNTYEWERLPQRFINRTNT